MSAPTQAVAGAGSAEPSSFPFISVVVPVRNEAAFIRQTLEQLLGQRYDPDRFEVLVVDGESTDATPAIVRAMQADHPNLKFYSNPRRFSSAARNVGVKHARGEVLVVVDGHCDLDNVDYLRDVAEAFRLSGADCLGRPQPQEVESNSWLQRAIAAARSSWLGHHPASFIYSSTEQFVPPQSVAVAYRRSVFETVGLFDERFDACEDYEFNHRVDRAGLRCFFTPRIRVRYCPRPSLHGLFRQMARYGRGRVRLLRKHPETFSLSSMIPALFMLGLTVGAVGSWFSPALAVAFAAVLVLYAGVVAGVSLCIALRHRQGRLLPLLPLVFLAVHLGCGWGVLRESLSVRRGNRKVASSSSSPQPVATGN
ncbi:MAG: glycosyltransferase family 2 protein [Planctomycetes bacterium]|nr:glycosyltransferase family 2 protein [Planctomycetota bacterium]